MTALERLAHERRAAHPFEAVVGAAARELNQMRHDVALDLLGVHEVREPELARQRLAGIVEVHADDLAGPAHLRALNHIQAYAAQAEHHHIGARLNLGGPDHRANAGGDTTA